MLNKLEPYRKRVFQIIDVGAPDDHVSRLYDLINTLSIIVMVKRRGKMLIPNGDLQLEVGDKIILYTQMHLSQASHIFV